MTSAKGQDRGQQKRQMKSASRLYAVQALFQMEVSGQTVEAVTREFETHRFGATYDEGEFIEGDPDHFRAVVEKAVNWQGKIDQMTDRALVAAWPIDRIDPVIRALFRAAGAELVDMATPPKVAIRTPARAGPTIRAALNEAELSPTALVRSSGPTISDTKDCRAGASKTEAVPSSRASR